MPAIQIPPRERRRKIVERIQLMQDAAGVIVLAPAAWTRLHQPGTLGLTLGSLELLGILAAVGSAIMELRSHSESEQKIDVTTLFIALVLLAEYTFARAAGHKIFSPTLLLAVVLLILAFLRPRLIARRKNRVRKA